MYLNDSSTTGQRFLALHFQTRIPNWRSPRRDGSKRTATPLWTILALPTLSSSQRFTAGLFKVPCVLQTRIRAVKNGHYRPTSCAFQFKGIHYLAPHIRYGRNANLDSLIIIIIVAPVQVRVYVLALVAVYRHQCGRERGKLRNQCTSRISRNPWEAQVSVNFEVVLRPLEIRFINSYDTLHGISTVQVIPSVANDWYCGVQMSIHTDKCTSYLCQFVGALAHAYV